LRLEFPFPVSVNQYYGVAKRGSFCKKYVTHKGRAYRGSIESCVEEGLEPLRGRIHMRVSLHAPTRRKYDIDNPMKCLLDAMTYVGIWVDDEQVDRLLIERGDKVAGGLVVVEVDEYA